MSAAKHKATEEADAALAKISSDLKVEADKAVTTAKQDVSRLSEALAGRVLGTDVASAGAGAQQSGTVK